MVIISKIFINKIIYKNRFIILKSKTYLNDGSIGISYIPYESDNVYNYLLKKKYINNLYLNNKKILFYINYINNIFLLKIKGKNPKYQIEIDNILLSILNKFNNNLIKRIILIISISIFKSFCNYKKIKLYEYISELVNNKKLNKDPIVIINLLNKYDYNNLYNLDIKDFMISFNKKISFKEIYFFINKINKIFLIYLNKYFSNNKLNFNVKSEHILSLLKKSINYFNFELGKDVFIYVNLSLINCFNLNRNIYLSKENNMYLDSNKIIEYINYLSKKYFIKYIENPSYKYDWKLAYIETLFFNNDIQLVGDEIFDNNSFYLLQAINNKIFNSILIKYFNISTISEIINIINIAKKNNYKIVISNIFKNINDTFFIDLAIGSSSNQVKIGYINNFYNYKRLLR